jgi:membrane protease YdiL (CAAX protease family)
LNSVEHSRSDALTVGVVLGAAAVAYAAPSILSKLDLPAQTPADFWGRFSMRAALAMMVIAVAVAPVAEEIFFRGFLYNDPPGIWSRKERKSL